MSRPRLLGAVLAGGRSRRFGSDKAVARLAGRRLVEHAAGPLADVCDSVVVVSSIPGHTFDPYDTLEDSRPDEGPLGAMEVALEHAWRHDHDGVFVVACDMPIGSAVAERLARAFDGTSGVAARRDDPPGFEPLCAIYPVDVLPRVTALLDAGERAARVVVEAVGAHLLDVGAVPNVNTVEDLRAMRDREDPATGVRRSSTGEREGLLDP